MELDCATFICISNNKKNDKLHWPSHNKIIKDFILSNQTYIYIYIYIYIY